MFLCACKTIQVIPFYRIYFSTRPPFSVNLKAAPFLPPLPNIYNECSLIPSSIVYIPDSFYPYSSICLTQFYKYFAIHGISWPIHHIVIIRFTSVFSTTSSRPWRRVLSWTLSIVVCICKVYCENRVSKAVLVGYLWWWRHVCLSLSPGNLDVRKSVDWARYLTRRAYGCCEVGDCFYCLDIWRCNWTNKNNHFTVGVKSTSLALA